MNQWAQCSPALPVRLAFSTAPPSLPFGKHTLSSAGRSPDDAFSLPLFKVGHLNRRLRWSRRREGWNDNSEAAWTSFPAELLVTWQASSACPKAIVRTQWYSFAFHYFLQFHSSTFNYCLIKYLYFKLRMYQFNMSALYNNSCLKIRQIARCIWLLLLLMFTFGLQSDYNKQSPMCYNSHFKL